MPLSIRVAPFQGGPERESRGPRLARRIGDGPATVNGDESRILSHWPHKAGKARTSRMNRKSGDLPGHASRIFFDGKEGEGPRCVFFISATLPFYMKRRFFYFHWQFLNVSQWDIKSLAF